MHRALGQLDVLTCILNHVENGDLTRLARTSRAISTAALNRLWRAVHILVLARCMPAQYWDEVETFTPFPDPEPFECGNGDQGVYTSRLALSTQDRAGDWVGPRFRAYAARVQSLDTNDRVVSRDKFPIRPPGWLPPLPRCRVQSEDTDDDNDPLFQNRREPDDLWSEDPIYDYDVTSSLGPDVLLAWHAYSQQHNTPLFPILTELRWSTLGTKALPYLSPLVTAGFSSLILTQAYQYNYGKSEAEIRSRTEATALEAITIIYHVVSRCLHLYTLDLGDAHVTESTADAFVGLPLQDLTEFRCNGKLASKCFEFLAALPNLRTLAVNLPPNMSFSGVPPALRELDVSQYEAAFAERSEDSDSDDFGF